MLKKWFLMVALSAPIVGLAACGEDEETAGNGRPNILLIVADDMGYSDIGCFGGEIATPTLDTLATEGLRLTNFHVLPTCSPTRSVLFSGTDNHRAGMGTMGEVTTPEMEGHPGYAGYLNFEVAALPEVLKDAGYRTYMAGKWHLGADEKTRPHARGFDETFTLLPGGGSHWSDRRPLSPPQEMIYSRNGQTVDSLPDDFYSSRYYTDRLLEWLKRDREDEKPFFAYLSFTAPHDPLHAPQEYIDKYKGKYDGGWAALRAQRLGRLKDLGIVPKACTSFPRLPGVEAWEEMSSEARRAAARDMEVYAAMIDYMDDQIERVLAFLRESGAYEDTLVLFFSDNGANGAMPTAYPGQTEEFLDSFDNSLENRGHPNSYIETGPGWAQASMAPSRLFKSFPAEGGIRSPLIVKLPGKMAHAGGSNASFLHVRDIMPTILDLSGAPHAETFQGRKVLPMQGRSALDLFQGKADEPYEGCDRVGYELFGMKAYFLGDWKILSLPKPFGKGEWELFNLREDPAEMSDLAGTQPQRLAEMVALWEQYKQDNGVLDITMDMSIMEK